MGYGCSLQSSLQAADILRDEIYTYALFAQRVSIRIRATISYITNSVVDYTSRAPNGTKVRAVGDALDPHYVSSS